MRMLIGLTALVVALVGCGGPAGARPEFENPAVFEAWVAASVGVESVACTKTSAVTARCEADTGAVFFVACQTEAGELCTIQRKA